MGKRTCWRGWLALVLIVTGAIGCAGHTSREPGRVIELQQSDQGRQVELTLNETLTITLAANPTTGYGWDVGALDAQVLHQRGDIVFTPDAAADGVVGAGGTQRAVFVPTAPGQTTLTLHYRRSWETETPPAQTFQIMVIVK